MSASSEVHRTEPVVRIERADRSRWRIAAVALVALLLIGATVIVYLSGGTRFAYVHTTYVAIIAGAGFFGLRGGLAVAAVAAILMGPLMPLDVAAGTEQTAANWLIRAGFFILVGGLAGLAFEARDRQLQLMRRQAYYNPLTGLPNRARYLERLNQLIGPGAPERTPLVLLCLKIGSLETITATLGHERVAALQIAVAERLKAALPKGAKLFHISRGTFALVVIGSQEEAARLRSRLLAALDEPVVIEGMPMLCHARVGQAHYPEHATDALALLGGALSGLQDAKANGQPIGVFDPEANRTRRERLQLLPDLQRALRAAEEITLHYQPQIDLRTGACTGAEALVRWLHPERGWVAPAEFVPLAEQTALIGLLAERVLNLAIHQQAQWQAGGLDLTVAVNLSIRNLEDDGLPGKIVELLDRHGVHASKLEVEVTESGLMGSLEKVTRNLSRLRELGISVALDDFGTGQSSISYLRDLPADTLKLDRSFLRDDAATDPRGRALLVMAIEGSRRLGFRVVAEGIETQTVYDVLCELSCDYGQGYFIAKPMPAAEFRAWLRQPPSSGAVLPSRLPR